MRCLLATVLGLLIVAGDAAFAGTATTAREAERSTCACGCAQGGPCPCQDDAPCHMRPAPERRVPKIAPAPAEVALRRAAGEIFAVWAQSPVSGPRERIHREMIDPSGSPPPDRPLFLLDSAFLL